MSEFMCARTRKLCVCARDILTVSGWQLLPGRRVVIPQHFWPAMNPTEQPSLALERLSGKREPDTGS